MKPVRFRSTFPHIFLTANSSIASVLRFLSACPYSQPGKRTLQRMYALKLKRKWDGQADTYTDLPTQATFLLYRPLLPTLALYFRKWQIWSQILLYVWKSGVHICVYKIYTIHINVCMCLHTRQCSRLTFFRRLPVDRPMRRGCEAIFRTCVCSCIVNTFFWFCHTLAIFVSHTVFFICNTRSFTQWCYVSTLPPPPPCKIIRWSARSFAYTFLDGDRRSESVWLTSFQCADDVKHSEGDQSRVDYALHRYWSAI